ncbi:MAG: hypothetical protein ACPG4N_04540, partial [Gammaproteobacteria bacterium]
HSGGLAPLLCRKGKQKNAANSRGVFFKRKVKSPSQTSQLTSIQSLSGCLKTGATKALSKIIKLIDNLAIMIKT